MLKLMFSEDIVDISISARRLAGSLALMLISTCPLLSGHHSDLSIRRMQGFDIFNAYVVAFLTSA